MVSIPWFHFVVRIGFRFSIHVHPQIALFRMVEFGTSKTTENPKDFWRLPTMDGRNPFRTSVQKPWNGDSPAPKRDGFNSMVSFRGVN